MSTTVVAKPNSSSISSKITPEQKQATEQELSNTFRNKNNELQALVSKIGELERELEEHALVIETLQDCYATEPSRKCFRLVGGILVERTVSDVLPELIDRYESIKGILGTLTTQYTKKEQEFSQWKSENNMKER